MTLLNLPNTVADINKRRGVAQRGINQGTVDTDFNPQGQSIAPLLTRAQNIVSGGPSVYLVEESVEEYQAEEEE